VDVAPEDEVFVVLVAWHSVGDESLGLATACLGCAFVCADPFVIGSGEFGVDDEEFFVDVNKRARFCC